MSYFCPALNTRILFIAGATILLILLPGFRGENLQKFPGGVLKLMKAYPGKITGFRNDSLIWFDNSKTLYDDGKKNKALDSILVNPDVEDQFHFNYPAESYNPPKADEDPGRIRNEGFFKKMYGATKKEVGMNLGTVTWLKKTLKQKIQFSKVNDAHLQLQKVSDELDLLPDSLKKYLAPLAGTFNWRTVEGTKRLSPHSFGIAIDLNVKFSDYWLWQSKKNTPLKYRNRMPAAIVKIFEKHGFIWGGKWHHYDTMHFEYRPELLLPD
jgi:hypothetical protein